MKKPGLALLIASKGKSDEEPMPESSDDYGVALDELAELLGVSEDKRADFAEAFQAAVSSCK